MSDQVRGGVFLLGAWGVWSFGSRVVLKPGTRWVFSVGGCRACGWDSYCPSCLVN